MDLFRNFIRLPQMFFPVFFSVKASFEKGPMIKWIVISLIFALPLSGLTLDIYNDSRYILHATIYSKEDVELSDLVISPGHSIKWQDSLFDAKDYEKGPFKVVFTCPNGDVYGVVPSVAQDYKVHARRSRGRKTCGSDTQPEPHRDFHKRQPHSKR